MSLHCQVKLFRETKIQNFLAFKLEGLMVLGFIREIARVEIMLLGLLLGLLWPVITLMQTQETA